MTELIGIAHRNVRGLWPRIVAELERACKRSDGRYTPDDVLAALLRRDMQLWVAVSGAGDGAIEAVCVTEIVAYPRERRCGIVFCAGRNPQRWLHHVESIADWARSQGCAALELQGRPGWERLLEGWDKTHVLLRKRI